MRSRTAPLNAYTDSPRWSHDRFIGLRDDFAASALMVSSWFLLSLATWQWGHTVAELGVEDTVFDPLADSEIGRWLTVALLCVVSVWSHRWARHRQESRGARPEHLWHSQHRPPDGRDRSPESRLANLPWTVTGAVLAGVSGGGVSVTLLPMFDDADFIDTGRPPVWILMLILILAYAGVWALGSLWARRRIAPGCRQVTMRSSLPIAQRLQHTALPFCRLSQPSGSQVAREYRGMPGLARRAPRWD